jgi:hypothetical protein
VVCLAHLCIRPRTLDSVCEEFECKAKRPVVSTGLCSSYQAQIPSVDGFQRRVDCQEFTVDFLDLRRALGLFQPKVQQGEHLAVGASALALVLI